MAVMIIILNVLLVPRWGMLGAVGISALANAAVNICYLITVRRVLGLFPYDISYFRLLMPIIGMVCILFLIREAASVIWPAWLTLGMALALAYLVFLGLALVCGLNADDKLIAQMIWARVRGVIFKMEVAQ
jgi:O-antigen/teichoic acid export membrane protein